MPKLNGRLPTYRLHKNSGRAIVTLNNTDHYLGACGTEETGHKQTGQFIPLKPVKQKSGKVVHAWAVEGDLDPATITNNMFTMEWPPKSGKMTEFPEVDRAEFFQVEWTCIGDAVRMAPDSR